MSQSIGPRTGGDDEDDNGQKDREPTNEEISSNSGLFNRDFHENGDDDDDDHDDFEGK